MKILCNAIVISKTLLALIIVLEKYKNETRLSESILHNNINYKQNRVP